MVLWFNDPVNLHYDLYISSTRFVIRLASAVFDRVSEVFSVYVTYRPRRMRLLELAVGGNGFNSD